MYSQRTTTGEGPRYGFGTSSRDRMSRTQAGEPGPGQYNARGVFDEGNSKNSGWTLVPRRPQSASAASLRVPGPGSYTPEVMKRTAPSYRIGSASRDGIARDYTKAPGPGNYNPGNYQLGGPSYRIGTGHRPPLSTSIETPGPGTYQVRPSTGEGPRV